MILSIEQDLLNSLQANDSSALGAIYDYYSPGLYRYAMRLLGDDCLAEDCVAETFSRFLKALRSGQGPRDHLQAYLYRIAHNWITDSYRRQPPPPLDLVETLADGGQSHPERVLDVHLEQQQVRLAMRSLPPDQQQVVILRFMQGWENDEVAAAMQKPVGTIRVLQHRAISALQRLLLKDEKECE
jgi:RNA polymerase sigma-70 factor (ECF subfamily)